MPDQTTVRRALERADFVVVQEAYASAATCDWADLLLPATSWGEKEGTVTNSERRISRVRAAVRPPSVSNEGPRHDWQIAVALARRLEQHLPTRSGTTLFPYETPEQIWNEHRESTRGRDLDITGMSYPQLDAAPQQWPLRAGQTSGTERLYADGVYPTADGRARFAALPYTPLSEERESRYPYALTTGRLRDQWHGMTRTGTLGKLFGHAAEPDIQMHPQDMVDAGLVAGDLVRVTSKRGELVLPANPSHELARRQCFIGMHWGSEFMGGRTTDGRALAGVNGLTTSAYCPTSKQPELKHAAVRIDKVHLPWRVQALAWLPAEDALAAQRALRPLLSQFDHATCVPFSALSTTGQVTAQTGLWFQAANAQAPSFDQNWLTPLVNALQLDGPDTLRYTDAPRHQQRRVRLSREAGHRVLAFLMAGDTQSCAWMSTLLRDSLPAPESGLALLQASAHPPSGASVPRSKPVCNCLGVTEKAIVEFLQGCPGEPEHRLNNLQNRLKCGTQCGSCVPELKRLAQHTSTAHQKVVS
jgi:assimilatory nitrate reductase catalytic subunit